MDLPTLFKVFTSSAFRLETLAEYRVAEEVEPLRIFAATGELPQGTNADWAAFVSQAVGSGKSVRRLRLLGPALSKYEQFELEVYRAGIAAGEEIRAAQRPRKPVTDFWLFDDAWIAEMSYSSNGEFDGAVVRRATESDRKNARRWQAVFANAPLLSDFTLAM